MIWIWIWVNYRPLDDYVEIVRLWGALAVLKAGGWIARSDSVQVGSKAGADICGETLVRHRYMFGNIKVVRKLT